MTPAADALRDFLGSVLPAGWRIQAGAWRDEAKDARFAVIKPAGGARAELVRQPQFVLSLIGALNEDAAVAGDAADSVVKAMRSRSGALVFLQSGEPAYFPTGDGRHVYELAVSAITH